MEYGKILKEIRKELGWTQLQLAKAVGTHKNYVSRVEMGAHVPSLETYERMLKPLGYELEVVQAFKKDTA